MVVVTALLLSGLIVYVVFVSPQPAPPAALTQEAKEYVRNLGLSQVKMNAKESMMNSMLVEIEGKITNKGGRALRLVEINCVFYDAYGQAVHRERVPIVRQKASPLKPSETRPFRLAFDALPSAWNQAMPQLVIANIDFEGQS
jgi:hypothetical protein